MKKTEEVEASKYQVVNKFPQGGFTGLNMMGMGFPMQMNTSSDTPPIPAEPAPSGTKCLYCGADVTGKKFCTECGGKVG